MANWHKYKCCSCGEVLTRPYARPVIWKKWRGIKVYCTKKQQAAVLVRWF